MVDTYIIKFESLTGGEDLYYIRDYYGFVTDNIFNSTKFTDLISLFNALYWIEFQIEYGNCDHLYKKYKPEAYKLNISLEEVR